MSSDQTEYMNDCGVQMLSSIASRPTTTYLPILKADTHGHNVAYNISPTAFIGTANMSTAASTTTMENPARAPPGFSSSQTHHPTLPLSSGTAMPIAYEPSNDAPSLMVRKISSFHTLDNQEADNIIKNNGETNVSRLLVQPKVQKIEQCEPETRHRRDRDMDSQSSRGGVPSTIYLRTDDDEDGISFSEDTLTACADSVAEYDRDYLRRAAMIRKDGNHHMTNMGRPVDDGYNHAHAVEYPFKNDDYQRETNIHSEARNTDDEEEDEEDLKYIAGRLDETSRIINSIEEVGSCVFFSS